MLRRKTIALALAGLAGLALLGPAGARAEAPLQLRKATVGAATSWFAPDVSPEELRWPAPPTDGMKNALNFGYAHRWKPGEPIPNSERVQLPLYRRFDSDDPKWWDEQLDEILFSRSPVVFLVARGCMTPNDANSRPSPGGMCPFKLRMMAEAVKRSAAEDAVRFAAFVDTGATFALRRTLTRGGPERLDDVQTDRTDPNTRFDMGDQPDSSGRPALWYFWDAAVRPWFDTVPRELWFMIDDGGVKKPVVAFWGVSARFTNQRGNASKLLTALKSQFKARYGVEPFFLVSSSWIAADPTLVGTTGLVGGVHDWFRTRFGAPTGTPAISRWNGRRWDRDGTPDGLSSLTDWGGRYWGVTVPGFDCGPGCRVPPVPRLQGRSFETVLANNRKAALNVVEGFNGPFEGTAAYRSDDPQWPSVNHYLKILRRFGDPNTAYTRLQAEGADRVSGSPAQLTRSEAFGGRGGVVAGANTTDWFLNAAAPDGGFTYTQLYLAKGRYRLIARLTPLDPASSVAITIGDKPPLMRPIPLAPDRTTPVVFSPGSIDLEDGTYDISLTIPKGSAALDYLLLKRER